MSKSPLGYIAYEGPSMLDGMPIVVIVNRIPDQKGKGSQNTKTGAIAQSFILRSNIHPVRALKTGADKSVCGGCKHRPLLVKKGRALGNEEPPCYVNVGKSVHGVWSAYRRGRYVKATPREIGVALTGLKLRIGTYGDGAAAPVEVWQEMVRPTLDHTGYTHQWERDGFDHAAWAPLVMASADSSEERARARALGMRVFRVVPLALYAREKGEAPCPASREAGRRATCATCMLCAGTSKKAADIVIADHAAGYQNRHSDNHVGLST